MKKFTLIFLVAVFAMATSFAQNISVTGVVKGDEGNPLPGVTVAVKGTSTGTVTDRNGKYSVSTPTNGELTFSFIGMVSQSVAVNGKKTIDVALVSDSQTLDEVMVVAYGTAKRSTFTGSASVINGDIIGERQGSNVTKSLAGQVSGVQITSNNGQPGTTATVRIRGVGSMAASNAPLYVVDGTPFDGDISSISNNDIESITVLKDAASNALYGARGANGVILITTKKGKSGEAVVSFEARVGSNSRGVSNYDVLRSPATYLEKAYESIYNSVYGTGSYTTPALANARANALLPTTSGGGVGYNIYTTPAGQTLIGVDGKINPNSKLGRSDGTYFYTPDNWYAELFDKGNIRQQYNVSVSGSNDKWNYYISGNYLDDSGIMAGSGFTRYATRLNVSYQAKKWLKIGSNISYSNVNSQYPATQGVSGGTSSANLFYLANAIAPIYPLYVRDADGKIKIDSHGFTVYDFGDNSSTNSKRTFMSGSNPASLAELDKRNYLMDIINSRWFAEIDIYDGLKFTYNLGYDLDNTTYRRLYNAYYGQYSKVGGIVYAGATRTRGLNQQQLLTYNKTFCQKHNIDAMIGHETYSYKYQYLEASKDKLYNPSIVEIDNAIMNPSASSYANNYSTEGYFARVQYTYNDKYVVSGSYRRDASSRFEASQRWGNFGSVGAAWIMNKEEFLAGQEWIDFLKFKASIGVQGNDNLLTYDGYSNYYPYADQYQLAESNGDFSTYLSYKGNKEITWESSTSFNTGFDFNFWKGKLSGSIEYFSRKTTNMLYYQPVPITLGYERFPINIGSLTNKGIEIDLKSTFVNTNNITVSAYVNATMLKNKILKLSPELNGQMIDGTRIYSEGESMYQFYLRSYAGVDDKGVALYYADDKKTTTTTNWNTALKFKTGNILPKVYGGFGVNGMFYGVDVTIGFAYQFGGRIYDSGYQSFMHGGTASSAGTNWHKDILKSWNSTTNVNSTIPRVNANDTYTNSTSDRFMTSSNYVDITNVSLGYTLPKSWTKAIKLSSLRVFVVADNVALFSARKGLDPRQSYTLIQNYAYSPIRSISGGLSLKF